MRLFKGYSFFSRRASGAVAVRRSCVILLLAIAGLSLGAQAQAKLRNTSSAKRFVMFWSLLLRGNTFSRVQSPSRSVGTGPRRA